MSWSAREWRQFLATLLLALGNVPLTAGVFYAQYAVTQNPANSLVFWLGQSCALLIAIDVLGLSAILGRRTFRIKAGNNEVEATGEAGERVAQHIEDTAA